ncbi:MAG TPA: hypothetical protein ENK18_16370 [Deltaproteobacteria bacterium]|nr:hypothetical protein [Deltaproteobacteria bacterium]
MLWFLSSMAVALPDLSKPHHTQLRSPQDAAVVVGIEDYFQLPDVPGARADAVLIADLLAETRGIPRSRIRVLTDGASREQILAAVDEAAALAPGAAVWLYFAGHGAASPSTGERLLLGDDARPDLAVFELRAVAVSELVDRLTAGGASAILLLDTCYTGLSRSGDPLFGKRFAIPSAMASPSPSALIWTATSPGEWSGTLAGTDHGAFTWAVAGALRGWADADADDTVDAAEASAWVSDALSTLQVTDQHPVLEASDPGAWVLTRGRLEPAPELHPEAITPSDDYLAGLEAVAAKQAELTRAHAERTEAAIARDQAEATAEWERLRAIEGADPTTALQGFQAFLGRWSDHTVSVDGVDEPAPILEVDHARERVRRIALALAIPGQGIEPPLVPVPELPGRWTDATGAVFRRRELYPLVAATSPVCAEQVRYERRSRAAAGVMWSTIFGGALVGASLLVSDPQLTTTTNATGDSEISSIGPMGIAGFSVMTAGVVGGIAVPLAMIGGVDGSVDGFEPCLRQATEPR